MHDDLGIFRENFALSPAKSESLLREQQGGGEPCFFVGNFKYL